MPGEQKNKKKLAGGNILGFGSHLRFAAVLALWTHYNTVSYDEIKQKVITQANDYHRVKAYNP